MKNITLRIVLFLSTLLNCCKNFGFCDGVVLFIKLKLKCLEKIKLPNLQHCFKLRNTFADLQTFHQIFMEHGYEIDFETPEIIIDGGANIGLFAILMANRFPNAKIICIEPDTENFEILQQNTAPYKNIVCENCGLWNKNTTLKVYDKFNLGKWGIIVEEDIEEGTISAISLEFLTEKYAISQIDILKLDIETSEKQVFSNNYQNWLSITKTLVIEFHDRIEKNCFSTCIKAMENTFSSYQYNTNGENAIITEMILKK